MLSRAVFPWGTGLDWIGWDARGFLASFQSYLEYERMKIRKGKGRALPDEEGVKDNSFFAEYGKNTRFDERWSGLEFVDSIDSRWTRMFDVEV